MERVRERVESEFGYNTETTETPLHDWGNDKRIVHERRRDPGKRKRNISHESAFIHMDESSQI
jgi:hypothetical protein